MAGRKRERCGSNPSIYGIFFNFMAPFVQIYSIGGNFTGTGVDAWFYALPSQPFSELVGIVFLVRQQIISVR